MSNPFDFKLEGMDKLVSDLMNFDNKSAFPAIRKGVRSGGKKILLQAKANVPYREGTMERALVLKVEKQSKKKLYYAVSATYDPKFTPHFKGEDGTQGKQSTDYYYPSSQEYGFKLKNGGYKSGRYDLLAARDETSEIFKNEVEQALNDAIVEAGIAE